MQKWCDTVTLTGLLYIIKLVASSWWHALILVMATHMQITELAISSRPYTILKFFLFFLQSHIPNISQCDDDAETFPAVVYSRFSSLTLQDHVNVYNGWRRKLQSTGQPDAYNLDIEFESYASHVQSPHGIMYTTPHSLFLHIQYSNKFLMPDSLLYLPKNNQSETKLTFQRARKFKL